MSTIEVEDFLAHYGKKGMRWGVRNKTGRAMTDSETAKLVSKAKRDLGGDLFKQYSPGSNSRVGGKAERQKNRALNKASRAKDAEKQKRDVDKARADLKSGKYDEKVRRAKDDFKKNKAELGSREARKILAKERNKRYEASLKSQEYRDGKEATVAIAAAVGVFALSAILSSAAKNM